MTIVEPLLSIDDLTVEYVGAKTDSTVVKRVSFDIAHGEILGLAGKSGCGKSTIAYAVCRLLKMPAIISSGEIRLEGRDLLRLSPREMAAVRWQKISMVFQSAMNALNPVVNIEAQFRDVLTVHGGFSARQARDRAAELLDLVNISSDRLDDYPHQFSGGMRQRIVIALALALNPRLVIMDEPTTALDVIVQSEILESIVALKKRFGFSVLFITHDLGLMVEYCDRIAVMQKGKIVELGTSSRIYRAPEHDYTRSLWASLPRLPKRSRALEEVHENGK